MRYARLSFCVVFAIGSILASRVSAADPLGLYAGAALGQSDVRLDQSEFGGRGPAAFDAHRDAWKLMFGLRPVSLIGAEFDYIDFGHARFVGPTGSFGTSLRGDTHPKATALFGVLYAPLPVPMLDVYAKAGVARLQTDVNASSFCSASPCVVTTTAPFALNRTDARLAYGAGIQVKFASFAARFEYERINAATGDPDLASLGLIWSF